MTTKIWGEAFADDGLCDIMSVRDLCELAEGECVRFFPTLRSRGGDVAPELVDRICARARQLKGEGQFHEADWLLSVLAEAVAREAAGADRVALARFAFQTGVHPAYIWPAAETFIEFGATAAWLGDLSRWGRAYAPPEVADYLIDVLATSRDGVVVRDEALVRLPIDAHLWPSLQRHAADRLAGRRVIMRWRARSPMQAALGAVAGRWIGAARSWFLQSRYVRRSA